MRIRLVTSVDSPYATVSRHFGEDLFRYLAPPSFLAKVGAYEGSEPGDEVRMQFNFPKAEWVSRIETRDESESRLTFTDRGIVLPFPLASWHHSHSLVAQGDHTVVIDDMTFSAQWKMLNPLVYLGIFFGFLPRKWQYKRYFEHEYWRDRSRVAGETSSLHTGQKA